MSEKSLNESTPIQYPAIPPPDFYEGAFPRKSTVNMARLPAWLPYNSSTADPIEHFDRVILKYNLRRYYRWFNGRWRGFRQPHPWHIAIKADYEILNIQLAMLAKFAKKMGGVFYLRSDWPYSDWKYRKALKFKVNGRSYCFAPGPLKSPKGKI